MRQRPLWTYFAPRWVRVRWMTRRLDRAFDRFEETRDLIKASLDRAVETIRREAPAHVLKEKWDDLTKRIGMALYRRLAANGFEVRGNAHSYDLAEIAVNELRRR